MTQIKHSRPYWLNKDYIPGTTYREYQRQKRLKRKQKTARKLEKMLRKLSLIDKSFIVVTSKYQMVARGLKPYNQGFYLISNRTLESFYCPDNYTPDLLAETSIMIDC